MERLTNDVQLNVNLLDKSDLNSSYQMYQDTVQYCPSLVLMQGLIILVQCPLVANLPRYTTIMSESLEAQTIVGTSLVPMQGLYILV